ncbi:hypothetical protein DLM76_03195 [Leptospira yasudae]|uniref:Uncharacterized protein n=1 Tax=Leptospira yasudae TaxID=2202201 RepID=A0ABX9M6D6_9LEPT|nr:hypothetical protein DLM77_05145 [Leptospira yasudae]RHX95982.1 hypothetical protein DLM76_03195 [Leptospira yasudae]
MPVKCRKLFLSYNSKQRNINVFEYILRNILFFSNLMSVFRIDSDMMSSYYSSKRKIETLTR